MNIGQLAKAAGVTAKAIRYYESIGLLSPAARGENGYRAYGETDLNVLRFLARARGLGFSVEECRDLLSLWQDRARASAQVKQVAANHCDAIDRKIRELQSLRDTLTGLMAACAGDHRPDCPILADLGGGVAPPEPPAKGKAPRQGHHQH